MNLYNIDDAFALQNPGYVLNVALWEVLGGDEFFLGRAFDWAATPEDRDFWKDIDLAWGRYVNLSSKTII